MAQPSSQGPITPIKGTTQTRQANALTHSRQHIQKVPIRISHSHVKHRSFPEVMAFQNTIKNDTILDLILVFHYSDGHLPHYILTSESCFRVRPQGFPNLDSPIFNNTKYDALKFTMSLMVLLPVFIFRICH